MCMFRKSWAKKKEGTGKVRAIWRKVEERWIKVMLHFLPRAMYGSPASYTLVRKCKTIWSYLFADSP